MSSLQRSRTGSFSFATQSAESNIGVGSSQSGGYSQSRSRPSRKYKGKSRGMSSSAVYGAIKRYNWRLRETKMISSYLEEQTLNTLSTTVDIINFPAPSYGPAANQRIGNKVQGVGIKVNMLFHNNAALPIFVRMLLLKVPQGDGYSDSSIRSNIFDQSAPGNVPDTSAPTNGRLTDITRQINRGEMAVIRDKVIVLNGTTVDTGVSMQQFYVRTPHMYEFADSDTTLPMNTRYVIALILRQANADESTGNTVEYTYTLSTYFKDN